MVTSAPPATADLLYLSSNCSTARQQPEVNTTPTLQHVCLFYHSCKAVWYKVCLTCSWEMMNNTFTHVERKYSKSSINHLKCPTASWIRHMCQVAVMLLSVHVCFLGWHLVFSTLLFSSRAWFSPPTGLVWDESARPCYLSVDRSAFPPHQHCISLISTSLFPSVFCCSLLSPVFLCLTLPAPHPLVSLVCNLVPSFVQSFAAFLSSCCSCSRCLASVILLLWSWCFPVFAGPRHCRDAH